MYKYTQLFLHTTFIYICIDIYTHTYIYIYTLTRTYVYIIGCINQLINGWPQLVPKEIDTVAARCVAVVSTWIQHELPELPGAHWTFRAFNRVRLNTFEHTPSWILDSFLTMVPHDSFLTLGWNYWKQHVSSKVTRAIGVWFFDREHPMKQSIYWLQSSVGIHWTIYLLMAVQCWDIFFGSE